MRNLAGPLFATTLAAAIFAAAPAAAAGDAETIEACLKTERDAGRSGRECIGRVSDPCLSQPGNDSTTNMVQCVDGETKVWDDLLNADYQRLLGVLPSTAVESVRQAQRSWIVTRDADCHVPYDIFEGGTMARLDSANCVLDHTALRVLQLRDWHEMAQPN